MEYKTRLTNSLRDEFVKNKAWHDLTFYHYIDKSAKEFPERVVFIDDHRTLTYFQLKDQVDRCAAFLKSIGIGPGDVVTLQFPNRIEFPILFFSLIRFSCWIVLWIESQIVSSSTEF